MNKWTVYLHSTRFSKKSFIVSGCQVEGVAEAKCDRMEQEQCGHFVQKYSPLAIPNVSMAHLAQRLLPVGRWPRGQPMNPT